MRTFIFTCTSFILFPLVVQAQPEPDRRFPLFTYLTTQPAPAVITYAPSQLDPRQEANQRKLATSSLRADLETLRPRFDGLILYGYHEAVTPRLLGLAKALKFRAVLLGIWDPKSGAEVDGVIAMAQQHEKDFALGVLVGNEGLTFKRYEQEDLTLAGARCRARLPKSIPLGTTEPLVGYQSAFVRDYGDFLAPNIHPVFDRPNLGPVDAAAWAREQATVLAKQTGKPVLVKETGFPHAGKAGYTAANQKAFWEAYLKPGRLTYSGKDAKAWTFHGIAFDAFDLPWKSEESKLEIEKSWGLWSNKRVAYPAVEAWEGEKK